MFECVEFLEVLLKEGNQAFIDLLLLLLEGKDEVLDFFGLESLVT